MVVQVFFAGLVHGMLLQDDIELSEQVNFISNELESVVDSDQETLLNHEFLDVTDGSAQVSDTLVKPVLCSVGAISVNVRYNDLNLVIELLGRWLELVFDDFGVKLEETDISA